MKIIHTDGRKNDFIQLCRLLDEDLEEIVGGDFQRQVYEQFNQLNDIHDVVLIYDNEQAVACGSYKRYNDNVAEIKRVFVRKKERGRGLSKKLMAALEKKAVEQGYKRFILETGLPLQASMGLYKSIGFKIMDNYGQYKNMKDSICMEKNL